MINREEALKECIDVIKINERYNIYMLDKQETFIDKIYDSIGSCGECKHFCVIEPEQFLNCNELGCEVPDTSFFCSRFEAKQ